MIARKKLCILLLCVLSGLLPLRAPAQALLRRDPVEDEQTARAHWEQLMSESEAARRGGDYEAARKSCEKAVALCRNFPRPDTHLAQSQVQMGNIYLSERKPEVAEPLFKEAIRNCELAVGPQHPLLIIPLESLANGYYMKNRYDQVAEVYQRILAITEHGVVMQNLEVGRRSRNLADAYFSQKEYTRAEPLYLRAIALADPSGDINAMVEFRLSAGHLYETINRPEAAAEKYKQAADLSDGVKNDFMTFQALQSLTQVWRNSGHYEPAEAAAQRAVALREKSAAAAEADNDRRLDLAVSLANLAQVYLAWDKAERAESLYRRSVEIVDQAGAPGNNEAVAHRLGLATAERKLGKLSEAEKQYKDALVLLEAHGGSDPAQMIALLDDYATVMQALNKSKDAEALRARAEALRKTQSR